MKTIGITLLALAKRNLHRKPFRTIALILAVTVVTATLFAATLGTKSVLNSLELGVARLGADVIVVPAGYEDTVKTVIIAGEPSFFSMEKSVLDRVRAVKGVERASPQYYFKSARYPCCDVLDVLLVAFDPATDFTLAPWMEQRNDGPFVKDDVLVGREIPFMTGDIITFFGKQLNVAGSLESTGMDFIDHTVFMSFETAYEMARLSGARAQERLMIDTSRISSVMVRVQPDVSPRRAAVFIEYEIAGVKAVVAEEIIGSVKKQLFFLFRGILGISALLWLMAVVLMSIVFSVTVNERQREMGILRALGATRGALFTTLMSEAVMVSSIGGIVGVTAGGLFLYGVKNMIMSSLSLPHLWPSREFTFLMALLCFIVALATGLLAAFTPVYRSSVLEPYEAIRQG